MIPGTVHKEGRTQCNEERCNTVLGPRVFSISYCGGMEDENTKDSDDENRPRESGYRIHNKRYHSDACDHPTGSLVSPSFPGH
jgi:hypothetical protein